MPITFSFCCSLFQNNWPFFFFPFSLSPLVDGKDIGTIQSKLLCQAVFDLYIGEDPFDKRAKEDFELGLASLLNCWVSKKT